MQSERRTQQRRIYDNCYFDWHDASENDIEDYEGE